MKLVTFESPAFPRRKRVGALVDDEVIDLNLANPALPSSMEEFARQGDTLLPTAVQTVAAVKSSAVDSPLSKSVHPIGSVKLCPPILYPGKILCSGLNYRSHVQENPKAKFLEDPRFFSKNSNTVIGPGEAIRHPGNQYQVDYEVELAVVIGRRMPQGTPAEQAMKHVFGYTILHDVSSRWMQFRENNEMVGKNFDTFCPIGPCLVTTDEIPDPAKLRLRTFLNGKVMQDGTNADWCFPLPRLLAWLSQAMTLEPGDIVSTGTPAGVGWFRQPQVFLKAGDVVRLEIEGIGVLENPVVAAQFNVTTDGSSNREMGNASKPKSPFNSLDHLAIVVADTESALKLWRDKFGLSVLFSEDVNGATVRLTHLDLGNSHLQLVQPLTTNHPLQEWLRQHGPGLHHFCLAVDNVDLAGRTAAASGLTPAPQTHQGTLGKRALFLNRSSTEGVQVELTGK